jgi:uncharacterized protein
MTREATPPSTPPDAREPRQGEAGRPVFTELSRTEGEKILARNHVGRLGYVRQGQVEIAPLHYVYADGWIWGRTRARGKVEALATHYWVAFEVDEIEDTFDWRSVLVRGGFYVITREERQTWAKCLLHTRSLVGGALTPGDPVPERDVLFRIAVQELTARAARSAERELADAPGA